MSSIEPTTQEMDIIDRLVREVSRHGPVPDAVRQMEAANTAALRVVSGPMSEEELRAVIYDAVFRYPSAQVH